MSDILDYLGIDPEDLRWYHLAACNNIVKSVETDIFFDVYESDQIAASQTDQMCLHCPVAKQCLMYAVENKMTGVWGGIYLNNGKTDKKYNAHKTPETWKALKKVHGSKSSVY